MSTIGDLLNKLQYGVGVIDKPARVVRNTLSNRPPLTGLGDFSQSEVVDNPSAPSGRSMLETAGVLGPNTPGLDLGDVLGFGTEVATDPLTYVGAGLLGKAAQLVGKGGKALGLAGKAAKATKGADAIAGSARTALPSVRGAIAAIEHAPGTAMVPSRAGIVTNGVRGAIANSADNGLAVADDAARSLVDNATPRGTTKVIDVPISGTATTAAKGINRVGRGVSRSAITASPVPAAIRAAGDMLSVSPPDATPGDEGNPEDYARDLGEGTSPPASVTTTPGYVLNGANQNVLPRVGAPGAGLNEADLRSVIAKGAELHPQTGISHGGSLREQPWYQDYVNMVRQGANMTQDQRMQVDLPTQIASVGQKFRNPAEPGGPAILGADSARRAARSQATTNQTVREAARLAKLDKRASDQKELATSQAEQWMMQNHPAAYAAIQQAKANQTEANAKLAMANNESPAGKIGLAKSDPVAAAAAGIPQEAIDAGKLQDEIAAGMAGPHTHKWLNDTYTNENWATGPEFAGSKDAFLAHVANNGLGISPQVASQWWDKNIAGTGIRGLATGAMNGAYSILNRLGM